MIRIFIDIDNIVADFETAFRKFLNKKTGRKLKREDIHEFEFYKSFDITREEEKKFHDEFLKENGYKKLKCVDGCKEGIIKLMEFAEIKFISARSEEERNITFEWLKKNKIPIREDCLILSKDKLSYSSQFDIIVEDKWEDAIKLAKNNKIVILFDYPWNQKKDKNGNILAYDNIIRTKNWEEIIKSIKEVNEKRFKEELKEDIIVIWKESISVQMHFNQLIMRNRTIISSIILAAFGTALALQNWTKIIFKIGKYPIYFSDIVFFIATMGIISYFILDTKYYFRLLLGAVKFSESMDKKFKNIGLTTSITDSIKHKEARRVLFWHYFIIFIALLSALVVRRLTL